MTLEEYTSLEPDFSTSDMDVWTFLKHKGVSLRTYYYWKCKSEGIGARNLHFIIKTWNPQRG